MGLFDSKYMTFQRTWGKGGAFDPLREDFSRKSKYKDDDDDDLFLTFEQEDKLEAAGIDATEFEWMSSYERQEALEEAGLDPEDFEY